MTGSSERENSQDITRYPESTASTFNITPQSLSDLPIEKFDESLITVKDYAKNLFKEPLPRSVSYVRGLFPVFDWIFHYPFQPKWYISDFIAGITVAIVLVPQAMSYATLAGLPAVYGLYSSFIGLLIYPIFATSKDISIGPVAVMSLLISKIIERVQHTHGDAYSGPEIAVTISLISGAIALGVGLLRLGFLVELIPLPAILAFTSGSGFTIICSQLVGLFGLAKINTNQSAYKVLIDFLKKLPETKVDVAFGLVGLFILFAWKYLGVWLVKRYPKHKIYLNYFMHIRTAIVIIVSTAISYGIVHAQGKANFKSYKITGKISSGLGDVKTFSPPRDLVDAIASELPVATIVLVLEHISISKSFGRLNGYKIDPNQELIAIGVSNMIGTFFNAYPVTGSFSRTALKEKCGVKTPFASVFTGCAVLLAIYCFSDAFYFIPKATLCAIIIHCVCDLIAPYTQTWALYLASPLDFGIFIIGVLIAVFSSVENTVYFAMCSSAAVLFWRLCFTNGNFLGRVRVIELINPKIQDDIDVEKEFTNSGLISTPESFASGKANYKEVTDAVANNNYSVHYRWVPLPKDKKLWNQIGATDVNHSRVHTRGFNPNVNIELPPPGVVIYSLGDNFVYPNSSSETDRILDFIKESTRRNKNVHYDRNWNEFGKLNFSKGNLKFWRKNQGEVSHEDSQNEEQVDQLPSLKILHLDFTHVVGIDSTSIHALIDLKNAIERYSGPEFEIHFSGISNPWVLRSLVKSGFGGSTNAVEELQQVDSLDEEEKFGGDEVHFGDRFVDGALSHQGIVAFQGTEYPFFHFEIPSYENF
ncbi:hypothetical protein DAMA08_019880 [Martiniozyma asiatica (nom. inval.)]|nr:hypothetical protein DAMA08_019880 [Martiniozyma asiatica]